MKLNKINNLKNLLSNNPFRVLGVPSNSGLRLIEKNVSKFNAYSKLGKNISTDYDFSFFNIKPVNRDISNISKSQNNILLDDNKIKYSLFWFVNTSPFDSIALENLANGSIDKTIAIWKKVIKNSITKSNYSAYNNLSTLLLMKNIISTTNSDSKSNNADDIFGGSQVSKHASYDGGQSESIQDEIKEAIKLKYALISSDYFDEFKDQLSKGNHSLTNLDYKDFFSESILDILKINYNNSDLINLFVGLNPDLVTSLSSNLIKQPLDNIKNMISNNESELNKDPLKGMVLGRALIKSTVKDIKIIKEVAGVDSYEYQIITDKLANQILQCGIIYQNKTFNDLKYLSAYEYALSICYSDKSKKRAKDTINHTKEEMKSNLCSCCTSIPAASVNKSKSYPIRIYKETSRSYWNRSVQYQYIDLTLYFCTDCRQKISDSESASLIVMGVGAFVGFVFGLAAGGEFASGFGGLVVGFIGGAIIANIAAGRSSDIDNNPIIKKYRREGWQFDQPSA